MWDSHHSFGSQWKSRGPGCSEGGRPQWMLTCTETRSVRTNTGTCDRWSCCVEGTSLSLLNKCTLINVCMLLHLEGTSTRRDPAISHRPVVSYVSRSCVITRRGCCLLYHNIFVFPFRLKAWNMPTSFESEDAQQFAQWVSAEIAAVCHMDSRSGGAGFICFGRWKTNLIHISDILKVLGKMCLTARRMADEGGRWCRRSFSFHFRYSQCRRLIKKNLAGWETVKEGIIGKETLAVSEYILQ